VASVAREVPVLIGRREECARLDALLTGAKAGRSGVLVLRGQAGTGKSALVDYAAEGAEGWRTVRAEGVESEMELPFAGLHQLCSSLLGHLDRLPPPQREALGTAFGLTSGVRPDRFLISLATLGLLSEAAEEAPLLCLVDDAQWLDRSSLQVLAFVARRLEAESVALVFAVREPFESNELARLSELRLNGLSSADARELLASVIGAPLDESVRARILAEARGNPLALLELPREFSSTRLWGGFEPPSDGELQGRIEASFLGRVQQLTDATRLLLLLAAADPTGEAALLWRSAAELSLAADAIAPAVEDGLLEVGARVVFRHPLLRSAIYRQASPADRQAVHRALAAATDTGADPDRRAWHLAQAALGPDDDVAAELERSAGRAQARGGVAAAAAFLSRSAELTLDAGLRARRALHAASAMQLAGAPEEALALLSAAAEGPLGGLDRATLQRLDGQIALDLRRGDDAVPLLLGAARALEPLDVELARETYLEALRAASVAGRLGRGMRSAATAARHAPPPRGEPRAIDALLDGLAIRFTDGYAASAESLRRALAAVRDDGGRNGNVRWPWIARRVAPDLFDDDAWHVLATGNVENARASGALVVLPLALNLLALVRCFEGGLSDASSLIAEADGIAEATGTPSIVFGRMLLTACRGEERAALALIEAGEAAAISRGEGVVVTFGEHARALLLNATGQHEAALAPAQSAGYRDELMVSVWALPELVEAATRCGRTDVAVAAMERLAERTSAAGTDLALGVEARARALLSDDAVAEALYREAVDRLGRTRFSFDLARAHLLYGEWLRRGQRRSDAREPLRNAFELFGGMGAAAFANRARRELLATGETVMARSEALRSNLTPQESQIAHLACEGLSNPEIGARLFISPRTVQYHLRKVFAKLDITSRNQLVRVLPGDSKVA
jgi:DNA-binding CsgD family transcriptional regulator